MQFNSTGFGKGAAAQYLPGELAKYGNNVMLAYGGSSIKQNGVYNEMTEILKKAGKNIIEFSRIMPNPTYVKVQEGATLAKKHNVDLILAVGGGSVIDCCKIVSAQAKTEVDIWSMEFEKHQFPNKFIPMGAIVTVAGTGSEMNTGAVITNEKRKLKQVFLEHRQTLQSLIIPKRCHQCEMIVCL